MWAHKSDVLPSSSQGFHSTPPVRSMYTLISACQIIVYVGTYIQLGHKLGFKSKKYSSKLMHLGKYDRAKEHDTLVRNWYNLLSNS